MTNSNSILKPATVLVETIVQPSINDNITTDLVQVLAYDVKDAIEKAKEITQDKYLQGTYSSEFLHWDESPEQRFMQYVIRKFNEEGVLAYNDTNDNDVCDSIAIIWKGDGIKQKIFFPNSNIHNPDNEEFNTFLLRNELIDDGTVRFTINSDDETPHGENIEFFDFEDMFEYVMNC